jgi:NTP pyrophosphatase (non-canonical NTP hydrolase)
VELQEFQSRIEQTYGARDRQRGVPSAVAWLCEEVGELAQAIRKGTRDEQLHELGDVLAWVTSIAVLLDLSIEEAVERYVSNPP